MGSALRADLVGRLTRVRGRTLDRLADLDDEELVLQTHPDWSPIGWHLGHIAYTEAYWLLGRCGGDDRLALRHGPRFVTTGLPKGRRARVLPGRAELEGYLREVREETLRALGRFDFEEGDLRLRDGRIVHMVIQHEAQHLENIAIVLRLLGRQKEATPATPPEAGGGRREDDATVAVPGGRFVLGASGEGFERAYDNEREAHAVDVAPFRIDVFPVTNRRYLVFIEAGGYARADLWSEAGRAWLARSGARAPFGWERVDGGWLRRGLRFTAPVVPEEPVMGVSAHEADAFARFEGKRLPTEAEWERAAAWNGRGAGSRAHAWGAAPPDASRANHDGREDGPVPVGAHPRGASLLGCQDLHGNVWEWTSSFFAPYPGFTPFAYEGYSTPYFDGMHRVLRGGSFASSPEVLRATFRNWYLPHIREIFAGFRCASDE
jgi:iron(II)-dependent oxidoreductase